MFILVDWLKDTNKKENTAWEGRESEHLTRCAHLLVAAVAS